MALTESAYIFNGNVVKGTKGNGITSIIKTSTSGLVDTYTITYTNGSTQTYTVTNGQNGTDGQDGAPGQDGVGIASVSVNENNHLIVTKTDGTVEDAGEIQGGESDSVESVFSEARRNLTKRRGSVVYAFDASTEGLSGATTSAVTANDYSLFKKNTHTLSMHGDSTQRIIDCYFRVEEQTFENNNFGVWLYIPTPEDLTSFNYVEMVAGTVNAYGQISGSQNVWSWSSAYLNVGWNFCPFNKSHTLTSFTGIRLRIVDINPAGSTSFHEKTLYFDSIVTNYQMKPCVLLAFDNSADNNMYSVAYAEAKERGIQGTFAYQGGDNPDGVEPYIYGVTREHLNEMLKNGWDVAQYDGFNMQQDIDDIKAYNALLRGQGLDMTCYFPRFNAITADIWSALSEMGFKMCRVGNSFNYITSDCLDVIKCTPFSFTATTSSVLDKVNTAIAANQSICILIHKVVPENDGTTSNCLLSEYQSLLDGLKALRDSGDIDIITFKEYYYDSLMSGVSSSASWGGITGTLANQTDLKDALDDKLNASYAEIVAGGSNLVDFNNCKYGWRPSTSYTEGTNDPTAFTTNLIPCERNEKIKFYIKDMSIRITVYAFYSNGNARNNTETFVLDDDGYYYVQPNFSDIAYIAFCPRGTTRANFETLVVGRYDTFSMTDIQFPDLYLCDKNIAMAKKRLKYVSDVLYGKKWAVAGDSFSAGTAISETIPSGKYAGQTAVYPYLIGNRTEMEVVRFFEGGRTLAYPADETSTNSFAYVYQNIAADTDYLTIYLGINDSHKASAVEGQIPLGTASDNTTATFYGAWNVILSWLIENRPNLKIGIIVSNGCDSDDYRVATIEMATKYGIPYIDMNGDSRTPCMIRSTNPNIASAVKTQRNLNWRVSSENTHPNAACHAYEATFIENFLRSL